MSNWIDDGFGNKWHRCKLGSECGLHVVRPGKAQCWCQDQEASRVEVQAAREEIAKLEDDNDRLREESKAAKVDRDLAGWDDYAVINELKRENAALRDDKARLDAAIASWDEERERALREANRVLEWRGKCEQLERENAALRNEAKYHDEADALRKLRERERDEARAENAALREYKKTASERLRYLSEFWNPKSDFRSDEIGKWIVIGDHHQMIKAIDAARKEAQP